MRLLSIDPGPKHSGAVIVNLTTGSVEKAWPEIKNDDLRDFINGSPEAFEKAAIEMVASYGMAVGKDVFETVRWIGRLEESLIRMKTSPIMVYRKDVKMSLCQSMRAKDANIRQAILDLYPATGGGKTPQVGTKAAPGPLFGISKHAWSALAVAKTYQAMHT
jgi:hypothetical protein